MNDEFLEQKINMMNYSKESLVDIVLKQNAIIMQQSYQSEDLVNLINKLEKKPKKNNNTSEHMSNKENNKTFGFFQAQIILLILLVVVLLWFMYYIF